MIEDFYVKTIARVGIAPTDTVLVVCGGGYDREVLLNAKLTQVTISNLDYHAGLTQYAPYEWRREDAEDLTCKDGSYDWCIVNAGLHHCASPHRGLCEMFRVARKGVVVLEARDSLLMRAAIRLGLTQEYEVEPAVLSDGKFGGYRNTPIPNYIYRWTEREVEKTVNSYAPARVLQTEYVYGFRIPMQRMTMSKSAVKRSFATLAGGIVSLLKFAMPRQGNQFAFIVRKTEALKPWLKPGTEGPVVNLDYLAKSYDKAKYDQSKVDKS
jgi:ubiquinone/menaquinone biosynthesis C-methylase UbiE